MSPFDKPPASRPMPIIGPRCHELRIRDEQHSWRLIYRIDHDAIVVAVLLDKKTEQTPDRVIEQSRTRLRRYDLSEGE
jgi:phage-related protein